MVQQTSSDLSNIPVKQRIIPLSTYPAHLTALGLTILISIFLRLETVLGLANWLYDRHVHSVVLYVTVFAFRFILGGIMVLVITPLIVHDTSITSIGKYLNPTTRRILFGCLSGSLFLLMGIALSASLGIFHLDFSIILANPNVYVEPDVTGFAFFILALVPAVWEELLFRGILLSLFIQYYSKTKSIVLSSVYFALYHFSVIIVWPVEQVLGGVVMSFFFGLAWGSLTLKTGSILPSVIAHYIVDSMGQIVLNVDGIDPLITTQYLLILTLTYPIFHYLIFRWIKPLKKEYGNPFIKIETPTN